MMATPSQQLADFKKLSNIKLFLSLGGKILGKLKTRLESLKMILKEDKQNHAKLPSKVTR